MYLYVWRDGTAKQVESNPTVVDLLGVRQGVLSIYRYRLGHFYRLTLQENTSSWERIPSSSSLTGPDFRLHT